MTKQDQGPQDVVAVLEGTGTLVMRDPEDAALAIVQRILASETPEDVLNVQGTEDVDSVLGQTFVIQSLEWLKSAYEEGSPVFALIRLFLTRDGSERLITCGGRNVVAQLARLAQLDAIDGRPLKLLRNERPTSNGYYPLWLTHGDAS